MLSLLILIKKIINKKLRAKIIFVSTLWKHKGGGVKIKNKWALVITCLVLPSCFVFFELLTISSATSCGLIFIGVFVAVHFFASREVPNLPEQQIPQMPEQLTVQQPQMPEQLTVQQPQMPSKSNDVSVIDALDLWRQLMDFLNYIPSKLMYFLSLFEFTGKIFWQKLLALLSQLYIDGKIYWFFFLPFHYQWLYDFLPIQNPSWLCCIVLLFYFYGILWSLRIIIGLGWDLWRGRVLGWDHESMKMFIFVSLIFCWLARLFILCLVN